MDLGLTTEVKFYYFSFLSLSFSVQTSSCSICSYLRFFGFVFCFYFVFFVFLRRCCLFDGCCLALRFCNQRPDPPRLSAKSAIQTKATQLNLDVNSSFCLPPSHVFARCSADCKNTLHAHTHLVCRDPELVGAAL